MMFVFGGNCYLRSYLTLKLFISYVILKKLRFQYFLSIACNKERNYIIDRVSVIPLYYIICLILLVFHPKIQNFIVWFKRRIIQRF